MAENAVRIEGNPTITATISNLVTSPVPTYTTQAPGILGGYGYVLPNAAGVAAANRFVTLYNPVGSGVTVLPSGITISSTAAAAATTTVPMIVARFSGAPTGGTVQAASAIAKFRTSYPNAVAEVRTANPTVTLDGVISATPPVYNPGGAGSFPTIPLHQIGSAMPTNFGGLTLAPGEGIAVAMTAAGDTDQVWNISVYWAETT